MLNRILRYAIILIITICGFTSCVFDNEYLNAPRHDGFS